MGEIFGMALGVHRRSSGLEGSSAYSCISSRGLQYEQDARRITKGGYIKL
jgi:hypothetical protein